MTESRTAHDNTKAMRDLKKKTARALKSAKGDDSALRAAVAAFIRRGKEAQLGTVGMNGFLAVDKANAIDLAGYTEEDAFRVMEIFDELMEDFYRRNLPPPEESSAAK